MADPTDPDRRGRRRLRVQREIAAAALRLASDRGWDHVTVDDIAAEVDIAPRTFFRYFPSKDDVLFVDHREKLDRLRAAIAARPPGEPAFESVRAAVLALAETLEDDRDLALAKARVIARTTTLDGRSLERQKDWQRLLAATIAQRLGVDPERDLQAQVIAGATIAAMQSAVTLWQDDDASRPLPELVAAALDLLDAGLARPASATT